MEKTLTHCIEPLHSVPVNTWRPPYEARLKAHIRAHSVSTIARHSGVHLITSTVTLYQHAEEVHSSQSQIEGVLRTLFPISWRCQDMSA